MSEENEEPVHGRFKHNGSTHDHSKKNELKKMPAFHKNKMAGDIYFVTQEGHVENKKQIKRYRIEFECV